MIRSAGRSWTDAQVATLQRMWIDPAVTLVDINETFGLTPDALRRSRARDKLGLDPRRSGGRPGAKSGTAIYKRPLSGTFSHSVVRQMYERMIKLEMSVAEVGELANISPHTIWTWRTRCPMIPVLDRVLSILGCRLELIADPDISFLPVKRMEEKT